MPALCLILNSAYYANNYASIFDAGLSTDIVQYSFIKLFLNQAHAKPLAGVQLVS